ncbi:subclass B3 metallo-beta-lactamase [bacterium]|nr:subclass B3 metallo-beta-lactamase [bacterium]
MSRSRLKSRSAVVACLTACLAALAPAALAQRGLPESWSTPREPFRVIDDVYYVGTAGLAAWLIPTPKGHILIDGGLPESAAMIAANIEKLGFRIEDVVYLLNSHAHFDHSGGLAELKRKSGARLIAHEGDKSALEGGFYLGSEAVSAFAAPPVKVDRAVKDGDTVELAGRKLVANHTPGHSRGCTSWGFTVTDGGKSYDALIYCSSSVAANRLLGPPQYANIVADYRKTFAKAETMNVDVFLAPHTEFFDLEGKWARLGSPGPNPFIAPGEFQPFIARSKADFEVQLKTQTDKATGGG